MKYWKWHSVMLQQERNLDFSSLLLCMYSSGSRFSLYHSESMSLSFDRVASVGFLTNGESSSESEKVCFGPSTLLLPTEASSCNVPFEGEDKSLTLGPPRSACPILLELQG